MDLEHFIALLDIQDQRYVRRIYMFLSYGILFLSMDMEETR